MSSRSAAIFVVLAACLLVFQRPGDIQAAQWLWMGQPTDPTRLFYDVAYGDGTFVAVGTTGSVMTSPDGKNWTAQNSTTSWPLNGVGYSEGTFVAVGSGGLILTSTDGQTWTWRTTPTNAWLIGVAGGGGVWIAVGVSGTILRSTNGGATWESVVSGSNETLVDVAFGAGRFVAVGYEGTILLSADGGETWEQQEVDTNADLNGVGYGAGQFVVVGGDDVLLVSPDGQEWTARTTGGVFYGYDVAFGNGKFVVAGLTGYVLSSSDGEVWVRQLAPTQELRGIAFGDGMFVGVGQQTVVALPDGWTHRSSEAEKWLNAVIYAEGRFVAVGFNGALLTSPDGETWTERPLGGSAPLSDVAYGDGKYVAVGRIGVIFTSSDGESWQAETPVGGNEISDVVYDGEQFVAVGDSGRVLTSPDGEVWTERSRVPVIMLNGVAYGAGMYVAVGSSNQVFTSPDGVTWTSRDIGVVSGRPLNDVVYAGGRFVAVGNGGTVATSPNGLEWTLQDSGTDVGLRNVAYGDGLYVAVGVSNADDESVVIISSPDTVRWTAQVSGPGRALSGIAYGGGRFVAVGNGVIVTADTNADLADLRVGAGTLLPAFNAATTSYAVYLAGATSLPIVPVLADEMYADVTVNGVFQDSGVSRTVPLGPGVNPVAVTVTSQAGNTKTYVVTAYVSVDGSGTLAAAVSDVTAGSGGHTLAFTYTAPEGGMDDGAVQLEVPDGWSAPSVVQGDPGYTTAGAGTVSVSDRTITVSGLTLASGESVTITYGDRTGGGPGASAPTAAGPQRWEARSKVTAVGTLTALAVSPIVTVEPAAASRLQFVAQPGGGTGGTAWTSQPSVAVTDPFGNTVTTFTGAVTLGILDMTGTEGATLTCDANPVQAVNGVAAFSGCKIDRAGTGYKLIARSDSLILAHSDAFDIAVGPAATFIVTPAVQETTAGEPFNVAVTVQDAGGNTVTDYRGTVRFTSTDSQAELPADYAFQAGDDGEKTVRVTLKTAGNRTVTVTDTGNAAVRGTSGGIVVEPAEAAGVTVTANPGSIIADGTAKATVTARVRDAFGNAVADGTRVLFAVTDGQATLTRSEEATVGGTASTQVSSGVAGNVTVRAAVYNSSVSGNVSVRFIAPTIVSVVGVPDNQARGTIDPSQGGIVQARDGSVRLEIPGGAIEAKSSVQVDVRVISGAQAETLLQNVQAPPEVKVIGKMFEFRAESGDGASEVHFVRPVRFTAVLSTDDLAVVVDAEKVGLFELKDDGSLAFVGGKVVDGRLTVELDPSGRYVLGEVRRVFRDLTGHWAKDDIEKMASKYIVEGLPDGRFDPDGQVTRAELVAMLVRAMGLRPEGAATAVAMFQDVGAADWYFDEVAAAEKAGLVEGFDDGTFRPRDPVTREQVAVMIARALWSQGKATRLSEQEVVDQLKVFQDGDAVSLWARSGMAQAVKEGIVLGQAPGVLAPQAGASRAEAAVMIARYWNK